MKKKKVVMIGSSCIDEYYEMEYAARLGEKTLIKPLGSRIGGMIGNAAAVAASYGLDVYLMDTINRGESTALILDDCAASGIKRDMIRYDDSLPDVKCLIFLKDGERIVYVIPTQKRDIVPDAQQEEILKTADYVYTSIEELKRFRDTDGFMRRLHGAGTGIVLDVEYISKAQREEEWKIVRNCDLIFVNEEGNEQLTANISKDYVAELTDLGRMVVKTKGDKGCEIFAGGREVCRLPAYPVVPVDTTGAGDTFNASFLYALTQGWSVREAGAFANGAAARAILGMGARSGVAGEDIVKAFMDEWKGEGKYD